MTRVLRSIAAGIVGYAVFAGSALALFRMAGHAPHAEASAAFMLITALWGALFAMLGGYLAGVIAGRRPLEHAMAVAVMIAAGAISSLLATVGHGAIWTQVTAIVVMAPSALLGGWLLARRPMRTRA